MNEVLPQVLWTCYFLEAQGYGTIDFNCVPSTKCTRDTEDNLYDLYYLEKLVQHIINCNYIALTITKKLRSLINILFVHDS